MIALATLLPLGLVPAAEVAAPPHPAPGGASPAGRAAAVALSPPLARAPIDAPLVLNGGFGDYRSNHFHAGLDLGTGGRVGRPVFAPLAGWVERVRASGVGYGRAIYLHAEDGRLLVFAHLDAFADPLAAYVAAAQDSAGQYEQDLWPPRALFPVAAGQRIAWTGESGAGGPHLHFEIRRGDMAYHPLRAGIALADTSPPALVSLTLEPLDEHSYVQRGAAPHTLRLRATPETLVVEGRMRTVVGARDGVWAVVDRMVPWSTALEFGGERVECRFDSASWGTDMAESDYVYDAGRVVGEKGLMLWAPAGIRPRVLVASTPGGREAGTLRVRRGDPPQVLRLVARDLAGGQTVREVVLRPPRHGEEGPDPAAVGGRAEPDSARWFEFSLLPDRCLRVAFRGARAGLRGVTIGGRPASWRDGAWWVVVRLRWAGSGAVAPLRLEIAGEDDSGRRWARAFTPALQAESPPDGREHDEGPFVWRLAGEARFEPGPTLYRWSAEPPRAPRELVARSRILYLMPGSLPLRAPLRIAWSPRGSDSARVGLFADDGSGWSWLRTAPDTVGGRRVAETRRLGRFALFADTLAPRITLRSPPRRAARGAYSRWALEALLRDEGSGVDTRATWFEVDGRRVASEWDAEQGILRWRPRRSPAAGEHRFTIVATDRAGNGRHASGRFAIGR